MAALGSERTGSGVPDVFHESDPCCEPEKSGTFRMYIRTSSAEIVTVPYFTGSGRARPGPNVLLGEAVYLFGTTFTVRSRGYPLPWPRYGMVTWDVPGASALKRAVTDPGETIVPEGNVPPGFGPPTITAVEGPADINPTRRRV
jgi:hypothetical protein